MQRTCLFVAAVMTAIPARAAEPVDFNRDIRPLLSNNCFACHGPDEGRREASLRLDDEAAAKAKREGYEPAIVPGKPGESPLYERISSSDPDLRMPPADSGKSLTPEEIDTFKRWIAEGARWSQQWSYVPPKRHDPPAVQDESWPLNWVDRFLLARLEKEGLAPSPEADRVTLIRRLSFDLTGLPPTPEDVDAFLADRSPKAYENLVDRLLDSPHYGERMAMYWLDLVRYADTVGYHGDQDHNISPYRDYVIDSFNRNLPFDQFTREQLAGDLLENPTTDQTIATGYNRLLQTSHEGGVQPKEYLAIYAADRIRNLSEVWMGATMGCAQCHDHKFDPYTMRDFYSMQAFFADIDEAKHFKVGSNGLPTRRPPEIPVLTRLERERLEELRETEAKLAAEVKNVSDEDAKAAQEKLETVREEIKQIEDSKRVTMVTVSIEPRTIRILPRGNWLDESGEIVEPAIPQFLGELDTAGRATRLDLANWLVSKEGFGLQTARVFANRFWYLMFGRGITPSLDDFGGQGQPPVHPELLDTLAVEFYESGWDVKHMIKLLVMSRAYRQSSLMTDELRTRDPYNALLARQSRFRLPAEMVRDNALAVSGLLVREIGGGSVRPYQPAGYYRHLNFPKRRYIHHKDDRQWRRGVYMHWQRQFLHPMLKAFDAPSREECTAQRPRSNTPLASLTLLNDPSFVEAARVFAARILREGGETDAERLEFAYRWALSRSPDEHESRLMTALLEAGRKEYASDTEAAKKLTTVGLAPTADDLEVAEHAAWTGVARALLNLNEAITRN